MSGTRRNQRRSREKHQDDNIDLPKAVIKAQEKAKKRMQEQAQNGYSPGTMRKAQVQDMAEHASLLVVEEAVRAVEGSMLTDISEDANLRTRVSKVQNTSTDAVFAQERMEQRLDDLGARIKVLRTSITDPVLMKKVTQADIKHGTLTMKASVMLDESEKEQLVSNLEESQKIVASLEGYASRRNHILLHCLNGLANAKVASAAEGTQARKEVLKQLYALLHEDQSLEVPHNNSQVRLNHCLKICERIVARAIDANDVANLEIEVGALEKSVTPASRDTDAESDAALSPPPTEGDGL
eukprot:m.178466 g.178466  ORF g.178466 m.178466 type:complete len:297 (-) comp14549_c0_seq1:294-1184(-)